MMFLTMNSVGGVSSREVVDGLDHFPVGFPLVLQSLGTTVVGILMRLIIQNVVESTENIEYFFKFIHS